MNDEDIHSCRSGIDHILRILITTGEAATKYEKLHDEDLRYLRRSLDAIKEHKAAFMATLSIAETQFPMLDKHVVNLLLAAYDIGKSANLTNTAKSAAQSKSQSANGEKSGEARRRTAAETWHPKAKELTVAMLKTDPDASKAGLIRNIRENWPLANSLLPLSDRQIDRFISTIDEVKTMDMRHKPVNV